tara:strand:- start:3146 stop:4324 length:1179 start_codon:yes stop_codon:yes gene_type:complete
MALNTVSSDRLSTNVKNTNFTAAEKQDLTDDILPLAGQLGNRNLIINGAMQVAQRGTSSTTNGFGSVDRFQCLNGNTDEAPTHAQVDVASGTTPYTNGFRKALKITNGNQTGGAGADDYILVRTTLEAQDIANSGWNYTDSNSKITFSFWIKSSVAQNFYGHIRSHDGTSYNYPFETGSLSADTWTKVIKTIPGNSNLTFDNNVNAGLEINFAAFFGTSYTSGVSVDQWIAYASGNLTPDQTSTWYTTNDATLEITGLQLEVGSVATDFEHRSFAQELALCQRYFQLHNNIMTAGYVPDNNARVYSLGFNFPIQMRSAPSLSITQTGSTSNQAVVDASAGANITSILSAGTNKFCAEYSVNLDADLTNFRPAITEGANSSTRATDYKFSAEL